MIIVGVPLQVVAGLEAFVADFADVFGPDAGVSDGDGRRGNSLARNDGRLLLHLHSGILLSSTHDVVNGRRGFFFALALTDC